MTTVYVVYKFTQLYNSVDVVGWCVTKEAADAKVAELESTASIEDAYDWQQASQYA